MGQCKAVLYEPYFDNHLQIIISLSGTNYACLLTARQYNFLLFCSDSLIGALILSDNHRHYNKWPGTRDSGTYRYCNLRRLRQSFALSCQGHAKRINIDPFKHSFFFVRHQQTVQNQIRRRITLRLIRFSTVCLQKFLLKFE